MKKIFTYVMAFSLAWAMSAEAKQVSQSVASKAALNFMTTNTSLRSGNYLRLVYTATSGDSQLRSSIPLFYVYNVEGSGFVIISADDAASPVLGYSRTSSFSAENMPANMNAWLNRYEKQIANAIENKAEASSCVTSEWKQLLNGTYRATNEVSLQTPLWNQDRPYNQECPIVSNGVEQVHAATGCGATSLGIIMKYHNWPDASVGGEVSYLSECQDMIINGITINNTQTVTGNIDRTYQWDKMLDAYRPYDSTINDYKPIEYTEEQGAEVAALLFRIGLASNMSYDVESGATIPILQNVLINNFKYPGAKATYRNSLTTEDFLALIKKEIDANRPMCYNSGAGEHSFVCDGYGENDIIHINWGWGGFANGFFKIDALRPFESGIGGNSDDYSEDILLIYNIERPTENTKIVDTFLFFSDDDDEEDDGEDEEDDGEDPATGFFLDEGTLVEQGKPFCANMSFIFPLNLNGNKQVLLAASVMDKDGNLKEIAGKTEKTAKCSLMEFLENLQETEPTPEELIEGSLNVENMECIITHPIENGDKLVAVYSQDQGETWNPILSLTYGSVQTEIPLTSGTVGNETIQASNTDSQVNVYATNGKLYIETSESCPVALYSTSGVLLREITVNGSYQTAMPRGIYFVKVSGETHKVIL